MIKLFIGGYSTEKLCIDFAEKKDIRLILEGGEKLEEPVTFEYKEDGKVMGKIKLSFSVKKVDGFQALTAISIESGYKHKQYHKELGKVVNRFFKDEIQMDQYNYTDKILEGETTFFSGTFSFFEEDGWVTKAHTVVVSYDVSFEEELKHFDNKKESLWIYNGKTYEKINENLRNSLAQMRYWLSHNDAGLITGELIVNDGVIYRCNGSLRPCVSGANDEATQKALDELYALTQREEVRQLTDKESQTYLQLYEYLADKNVPIEFAIRI